MKTQDRQQLKDTQNYLDDKISCINYIKYPLILKLSLIISYSLEYEKSYDQYFVKI